MLIIQQARKIKTTGENFQTAIMFCIFQSLFVSTASFQLQGKLFKQCTSYFDWRIASSRLRPPSSSVSIFKARRDEDAYRLLCPSV